MKKAMKSKSTAKRKPTAAKKLLQKPVKKLVRATSRVVSQVTKKAKSIASPLKSAARAKLSGKKERKEQNVISFSELLERKKMKSFSKPAMSDEKKVPPHELLDKAIHECKPQAHTKLRSGMQGVRHK